MNHEELKELIAALRDREMGPDQEKETRAHLESCGECRDGLQRLDRAAALLFRKTEAPTRAETELFVQRVMGNISEEEWAEPWWMRWLGMRWTLPALGLGLAAACLSILLAPPEQSVAPADTLMLLNSQSRGVAEWILPPDPAKPSLALAFAPMNDDSGDR